MSSDETRRQCRVCEKELPLNYTSGGSNKTYRGLRCIDCFRKYDRERHRIKSHQKLLDDPELKSYINFLELHQINVTGKNIGKLKRFMMHKF